MNLELSAQDKELLIELEKLIRRQNRDSAKQVLEKLKKRGIQGNNLPGEFAKLKGQALSNLGHHREALKVFQGLATTEPTRANWQYQIGRQYQLLKEFDHALDAYLTALRLWPEWLIVYQRLGEIYHQQGQASRALDMLRQGVKNYRRLSPEKKSNGFAKSQLVAILKLAGKILLTQADQSTDSIVQAVNTLHLATSHAPNDPDVLHLYGKALTAATNTAKAIEVLEKAISLAPSKNYVHHALAQAYQSAGDLDKATETYKRVLQTAPAPYLWNALGKCYMLQKQFEKAGFAFLQGANSEPGKFYHWRDVAEAYESLGGFGQAAEALGKAIQLATEQYGTEMRAIAVMSEQLSSLKARGPGEKVDLLPATSHCGTIARYTPSTKLPDGKRKGGFGFIETDDGQRIFFHIRDFPKRTEPSLGLRVRFNLTNGPKGPRAVDIICEESDSDGEEN